MRHTDERTLPYFSISVEQLEADEGYMGMVGTDKGIFLRLLPIIWRANGLLPDYAKLIIKQLGITDDEWQRKRDLFLGRGLLVVSPDGVFLLNEGLRQQYLNTLEKTNSRRRI